MKTAIAAIFVCALAAATSVSCAGSPDAGRATLIDPEIAPNFAVFKAHVNQYLENRCASLDCHGQPGRGYRIYSSNGLRLYDPEAKLISGKQATTDAEIQANYDGLVGIEPEEMRRVIGENGDNPLRLLLLRKPTARERHKGGQVMTLSDAAFRCITSWLRLRNGQDLTPDAIAICNQAKAL